MSDELFEPTRLHRSCATMDVHRQLLTESAAYREARSAIESMTIINQGEALQRVGVVQIPVVVHVVWNTEEQNVSDDQITSQIESLNRDFRSTNPDIDTVPDVFKPLVADAEVEFSLADRDPDGGETDGIDRRQTTASDFGPTNDPVKSAATGGADAWPSDRYLNLWVCQLTSGLLGYAQFPGGPPETDGVVITHSGFGSTGTATAPFNLGRTATHEIGHWLNLFHIWGDDGTGCGGTDEVDDTPNQAGPNTGVPTFPSATCSNGPNGDLFMDYMDYTDDAGMTMFTTGQVARMKACLEGPRRSLVNASVGGR